MINPQFPTAERLRPWLDRLEREPCGAVAIVISLDENQSLPLIQWAFLSSIERQRLRRSLLNINRERTAAGKPTTTQTPS